MVLFYNHIMEQNLLIPPNCL